MHCCKGFILLRLPLRILFSAIPCQFYRFAVAQGVICYIAAALLGLKLTITVLYALLFLIPVALFYIALGLICGSVFNSKQVGGNLWSVTYQFVRLDVGDLV